MNAPATRTSPGVVLVQPMPPDLAASPEFRYLADQVRVQVEAVFGATVAPGSPEAAGLPLLVVGPRTLLTRRSLRLMARALDRAPGGAVVPLRLATRLATRSQDEGDPPGVYTLRGFEQLEETFLDGSPLPDRAPGPPPAVLLAPERAAKVLAEGRPGDPDRPLPEVDGAVTAGLCHEFVDYYGVAREDILPFLPQAAETVLEVGCARGATGRLLQERLGCRVTGVELNPVVAREASRHLHRVVAGDIETLDPTTLGAPFDAVVATELFEHLTRQEAFLGRVRDLLAPGGRLILSVPNVGHYSVVEDLIAGRWDYLPIGLLCHTHYRFFTRRTLEDWLAVAGFRSVEIVPQTTELPERFVDQLGPGLEIDRDSLATQGFYVVASTAPST